MNKTERTELLRNGKISTALAKMTAPAAAAMLVNAVYNVVDTAFIGMLHDTPSIGASAVVFPVFMLIGSIGLTFGIGAGSLISRRLGEQKPEEARKAASTAFYTTLAIGIIFAVLGNVFIKDILRTFGATDSIMDRAVIYGRIIIGGSVFQILNMCMNNLLRAEGAAGYSSRGMIIGAVLNMALDPLFMFVFKFGLAGAAAATITAQLISTLYLLRFFILSKGILSLSIRKFSPSSSMYGQIMAIGTPTFIRMLLTSAAMGVTNQAAGNFGDFAVAGVGITLRVISLTMMVFFGIGQGLQPLAGFNYGAKKYDRVIETVNNAMGWNIIFGAVMTSLFIIFARFIVGIFTEDPDVLEAGVKFIRFSSTTLIFVGIQNSFASLFQALGKGIHAGILSSARQGLFLIPAMLILPGLLGFNGVAFAQPLADILSFIVTLPLGVKEIRLLKSLYKLNFEQQK